MEAARGFGVRRTDAASKAARRLSVRRAAMLSSLGALTERVQPSSASLRVPAILAAVSILLVLGTTVFVLRDGRVVQDRVSESGDAVQPLSASKGTPAVERERAEQARVDTPRPQKAAQNTTVAVPAPSVHATPASGRFARVAASRRTAAVTPTPRVKGRDPRPADTRSSAVGTLQVGSEPSGAEVFVNGVPKGRTPLTLRGLPPGSRVVRLDMPGYARWSWSVAVVANKRTPLTVKLQPATRRTGIAGTAIDFSPRLP
jgi:hypothetical protein